MEKLPSLHRHFLTEGRLREFSKAVQALAFRFANKEKESVSKNIKVKTKVVPVFPRINYFMLPSFELTFSWLI